MLYVVEVDQSRKIEQSGPTILAFSDGISHAIVVPSTVKTQALRALRDKMLISERISSGLSGEKSQRLSRRRSSFERWEGAHLLTKKPGQCGKGKIKSIVKSLLRNC